MIGTKQYLSVQGVIMIRKVVIMERDSRITVPEEINPSTPLPEGLGLFRVDPKRSKIPIGWHRYLEVENTLPLPSLFRN